MSGFWFIGDHISAVNGDNVEEIKSILSDLFRHIDIRTAIRATSVKPYRYAVSNALELHLDIEDTQGNCLFLYNTHIIEKAVSILADKYFEVKRGERDESLAKYAKMKLMNDLGV